MKLKPKDLIKLLPYLRRLSPAGVILAMFLAPLLLLLDTGTQKNTIGHAPAQDTQVASPNVGIDPFRQNGAFLISQSDADRAGWSWERAKSLAADVWEDQLPGTGRYSGFYCGCAITRNSGTGGTVDLASCNYEPRASASRASRLEWEHIVPASYIGRGRSCWTTGAPQCVDKAGQAFKGRSCCMIADPAFAMAATDPVNLVPSVGEINGDRLDYLYGLVAGEPRAYGQCDMEIDRETKTAEPPANRRGDVARVWAYMSRAYGLTVPRDKADLYASWIAADPVSDEEIRINQAIAREGHRPNPFVLGQSSGHHPHPPQ